MTPGSERVFSARALGILGGTFDPVHDGHLALAREAMRELDLEQVLFVPNADPPHKQEQAVTSAPQREAMVAMAVSDEPRFLLSRIELDRPGPSYAVDTVSELAVRSRAEDRPEPWFILSAEVLEEFDTWREPERILELCRIAVAPRPGSEALDRVLPSFVAAAEKAQAIGLGVNAGHDLNLDNLTLFCQNVPHVLEVSIGHALIADALDRGLKATVEAYLRVLKMADPVHV